MPNVLQIPVGNGVASLIWNGRPAPGINTLLFANQDLNNTVYVGNQPGITPTTGNVIPLAPNGTISVDPASPWYVVGAAAGILPLVMVPNGQAYFLGITQGLGNLAIPSMQSPGFIHNITGWQIDKNGNAEFNNLTIRGTFFGLDFIINSSGAFFYNGTPALGNLKISIASAAGVDQFGNVYTDNIVSYNTAVAGGGYAQLASNDINGLPFLVLNPPGAVSAAVVPQVNASTITPGGSAEQYQINVNSGNGNIVGNAGEAVLQLISRPNDSSSFSLANLIADQSQTTLTDGNVYRLGRKRYSNNNVNVTTTGPTTILTIGSLLAGNLYRIHGWAPYIGNQAAGAPIFSWGASGGLVLGTTQDGFQRFSGGGAAPIIHNNAGALGAVTGPVFAANTTNWLYEFDIVVSVTNTGSLLITGAENTAGDSFAVTRISAWLEPT
jgi:hypothetical protein